MTPEDHIEKDGRPLRDIWTPTKESGEERVTGPAEPSTAVTAIADARPGTDPSWLQGATLEEVREIYRVVQDVLDRRMDEVSAARRRELEEPAVEGHGSYWVVVSPNGEVFDPAVGRIVEVNVFTDAELRRDLARAALPGDVLDAYSARPLSRELRTQEPQAEATGESVIRDGALVCPHCGAQDQIVELHSCARQNKVVAVAEDTVSIDLGDCAFDTDRFQCNGCGREVRMTFNVR